MKPWLAVGSFASVVGLSICASACPGDVDCDGFPDAVEAAVGGAGLAVVPGTAVSSASVGPAGIAIALVSALGPGESQVHFPAGTTAGATPITLEYAIHASTTSPYVVVNDANLPAAATKSIALPLTGESFVVIADYPGATQASLLSASAFDRIPVPPCPCPASTSTNAMGQPTPYVVTNTGDGLAWQYGLQNTAVGLSNTSQPAVPALSTWAALTLVFLLLVMGVVCVLRGRSLSIG